MKLEKVKTHFTLSLEQYINDFIYHSKLMLEEILFFIHSSLILILFPIWYPILLLYFKIIYTRLVKKGNKYMWEKDDIQKDMDERFGKITNPYTCPQCKKTYEMDWVADRLTCIECGALLDKQQIKVGER